jgi:predicted O-linked N-acetylglucosamine transferase (SPINDLY family)
MSNQKDKEALPLIERALQERPNYAEALANRAILHYRENNLIDAIKDVELAISFKPHLTQLWAFLGTLRHQNNNVSGAIDALKKAYKFEPENLNYVEELCVYLRQDKRFPEAIAILEKAAKQVPENANIWANLGLTFQQVARNEEAKVAYQKALAINPELAGIASNVGTIFKNAGDLHLARQYFEKAIAINPNFAGGHINLGSVLQNLGLLDEALVSYRRAIAIKPDFAEAHVNLGNTFLELGKLQDALASYQMAISIKPDFAEALSNLGITLKELGKLEDATMSHKAAIELKPDYSGAHNNLGLTQQDLGELEDAVASYQKAIAIKPDFIFAHSNLLFCLNYHPDLSADAIFAEHCRWDEIHARHLLAQATHDRPRDPNRRLRIGYVSPNFNRHSAASFIHVLLSNHDKTQCELFAYAEVSVEDEISKQLKNCVDHWQNTVGMSDETLAERIRIDGIDILVDLAGHTKGNRLLVFARKPAPIQVSWLGYGYTTGLQAMDYFLTDHHLAPIGSESFFSEKLLRLPLYAAYRPQTGMGDVGPLPALRNGGITFGSTSRSVRLNYRVIRAWAAILDRLPTSRLMINSASFRSEGMQARIRAKFAAHGVDPCRLIVGFESPPWDVLRQTDITLDCFPHNSGTTLSESLYMGVPFISLATRPSLGRIGATLLQGVGHPEWLATTEDEYIEKAVLLATDLHKLTQLRGTLRSEMKTSVLMNEPAFVLSVEKAYRETWINYCKAKDIH